MFSHMPMIVRVVLTNYTLIYAMCMSPVNVSFKFSLRVTSPATITCVLRGHSDTLALVLYRGLLMSTLYTSCWGYKFCLIGDRGSLSPLPGLNC